MINRNSKTRRVQLKALKLASISHSNTGFRNLMGPQSIVCASEHGLNHFRHVNMIISREMVEIMITANITSVCQTLIESVHFGWSSKLA